MRPQVPYMRATAEGDNRFGIAYAIVISPLGEITGRGMCTRRCHTCEQPPQAALGESEDPPLQRGNVISLRFPLCRGGS